MNTITERMVKLKTACMPNNNTKIKNRFSTFIHAAVAILLLIGNSSFTSTSKGQSFKNSSEELRGPLAAGDEINLVKISKPSQMMIFRADREIHMNMNSLIKEINAFKIGSFMNATADVNINVQFYSAFEVNHQSNLLEWTDQLVHNSFEAEHIKFDLDNIVLVSDNQIFKDFYLNGYSNTNPAWLTDADQMISALFYAENM